MPTLEISEETYEKIKDQLGEDDIELACLDDLLQKKWFFRTATYHMVGRAVQRVGNFVKLEQASWIADSGRFMQAIKEGTLLEVEPVGVQWVNLNWVVDFFPWTHKLPEEQK